MTFDLPPTEVTVTGDGLANFIGAGALMFSANGGATYTDYSSEAGRQEAFDDATGMFAFFFMNDFTFLLQAEYHYTPVPEPRSYAAMLAIGLAAVLVRARRLTAQMSSTSPRLRHR